MSSLALNAPETKFLLDCCRGGKMQVNPGALDWKYLEYRVVASGLAALVYTRLKPHPEIVPADTLQRSRIAYIASAAGNMRLVSALAPLLREITGRGFPVMLLKGSALLATVYGDAALRPMGDVDLLIRRQDIPSLVEILAQFDMHPALVKMSVEQYEQDHHHWIPYVARNGSLAVELHFDLVPPGQSVRPDVESIWQAASKGMLGGVEVVVPSPAHLLLHLTIHACTSPLFEPPLRGFFDMAQTVLASGASMDWKQFVDSARTWNASRQAWCGLHLAQAWVSAKIPASVLDQLERDCRFRTGERVALHRLASYLALRPYNARGSNAAQERLFELFIKPGAMAHKLPAGFAILWGELYQSARATMPGLPRWVLPFYAAFLHPFFLLARKRH